MFKAIKQRFRDMKTISLLISGADQQANSCGEQEPGAEHFVLSALQLPDGSAQRIFERFGANSSTFRYAIKQQYKDALNSVGINTDSVDIEPTPVVSAKKLPKSKPSGHILVKSLYAFRKEDKHRPLLGAHVMAVIAKTEHGVTARALKSMGVSREELAQLAEDELSSYKDY